MTRVSDIALRTAQTALPSGAARVHAGVVEHHGFVWRSLRRLGVSEAAADDCAQQVFCVFSQRIADVEPGKERTFLFGVLMRVAQAARRHHARRSELHDDEALDTIPSDGASPEEMFEECRARALLDELLSAMTIELRTVFILYEVEELTMAEIATVLDLPSGTVASRLRRARARFDSLVATASEQRFK